MSPPATVIEPGAILCDSSRSRENSATERRTFRRRMRFADRLPRDLVEKLWSDPNRLLAEGEMVKDGDRCTVVRVTSSQQPEQHDGWLLKRYNSCGPLHTCRHLLLRTRAERCWTYGRLLHSVAVPTPQPLAFLEFRWGLLRTQSYLLTEYVPATTLREFLQPYGIASQDFAPHGLETLARQFAAIWKQLGQLRLRHGDTKATNFLVTRDLQMWVIDLDGMTSHAFDLTFRTARRRDWNRFMKNWRNAPDVAAVFREAVLADSLTLDKSQ